MKKDLHNNTLTDGVFSELCLGDTSQSFNALVFWTVFRVHNTNGDFFPKITFCKDIRKNWVVTNFCNPVCEAFGLTIPVVTNKILFLAFSPLIGLDYLFSLINKKMEVRVLGKIYIRHKSMIDLILSFSL